MTDYVRELSTKVEPASKFTVDGEEYELHTFEHLSPEEEAEVTALFARHAKLSELLNEAPNVKKGKEIASRLRGSRIALLSKLTTCPEDVIEKLPMSGQAQLFEAVQEEVGDATDESSDGQDI